MTEKEKTKAYDEAIERAKKLYGNGITNKSFSNSKRARTTRTELYLSYLFKGFSVTKID